MCLLTEFSDRTCYVDAHGDETVGETWITAVRISRQADMWIVTLYITVTLIGFFNWPDTMQPGSCWNTATLKKLNIRDIYSYTVQISVTKTAFEWNNTKSNTESSLCIEGSYFSINGWNEVMHADYRLCLYHKSHYLYYYYANPDNWWMKIFTTRKHANNTARLSKRELVK